MQIYNIFIAYVCVVRKRNINYNLKLSAYIFLLQQRRGINS